MAARLGDLIASDRVVYCAFCMLPQPMVAEALARQDWDCVFIDCQHGFIDYADMLATTVAVQGVGKPVLVRPPLSDEGFIGKALDAGADGIICPMINSPEDAQWLAAATKYPPVGERSWGPVRAASRFGLSREAYHAQANGLTETWAMVETQKALDTIDAILSTPGIDGVFIGPNDLCNSLTNGEVLDPGHETVRNAVGHILEKANANSSFAGIHANTPELAQLFAGMGFRFISVGSDIGFLSAASAGALSSLKKGG